MSKASGPAGASHRAAKSRARRGAGLATAPCAHIGPFRVGGARSFGKLLEARLAHARGVTAFVALSAPRHNCDSDVITIARHPF